MDHKPVFTPGPWRQNSPDPGLRFAQTGDRVIYAANGLAVAMVIQDSPPDAEPNAHLIAAAPTLYHEGRTSVLAMDKAADVLGHRGLIDLADELRMCARQMRAALTKAEGRSS